ncbi:MAG: 30S ribosomal protein S6 [Candidatus Buchananbacteria bacterium RIFCSPHIGHO2_01_FULL_39_14]|uniref:Small ribosomal subunit protein bS6 n=2 Tax=Candidatus Buchananiibacteriota TaxID=1817903 RepID=A0A1G1YWW7_9BACT|nr:MAG: 30S ribosomal protein S6 [Candidatus Buchananbacteria bacterium RIFCSPHIGHO2_01_FULL_39_14]OGY49164.1 MAG: 30S ribosomal protein S6 [Candidatus Buchananbacteria bacterium RIFCSPHIGHO2_02_FULL_39_17]OGY55897.1 MAG: 30S ribosomal protein S6 [Candidatus Buchananbacteria bacterium RIFCSPLOWO2_01_FULL_40_23b]
MNHYELLYLIPASFTEDELAPIQEKVKELLGRFQGEITLEENLGKKKLAYPIKHNHQGYYLLYEFDLPGENLKQLDRSLRLTQDILRHIIVKTPKIKPKPVSFLRTPREKLETKIKTSESKEGEHEKIRLEDLDQKLDEILERDIL